MSGLLRIEICVEYSCCNLQSLIQSRKREAGWSVRQVGLHRVPTLAKLLGRRFQLRHLEPFLGFIANNMQIVFPLCSLTVPYAKLEAIKSDSWMPRGLRSPVVYTEHFSYHDELV